MTLLDRYFAGKLLATLIKALAGLIMFFILIDFLTHRRTIVIKHDIPWNVVFEYYIVFIPQLIFKYQLAALSVLVAGLLVLGDAAQNNEITAALSGGISLRRLIRVPVALAIMMTLAVFAMQETVGVPAARRAADIDERFFYRGPNVSQNGISWPSLRGGWTCHMLKFNQLALTGEYVFIHALRDKVIEQIQARRMYWDEDKGQWLIEDGFWLTFDKEKSWEAQSVLIRQLPAPIQETPAELFALEASPDTKRVGQLMADIRNADERGVPTNRQKVNLQAKFAQPALAFVMIWLAIPFAMRIRRGGLAIGFGISIAIALSYLMLFRVGMGLGYIGQLSPITAAWLANAVFLAIGLYLFQRTPT